jgi:hypothetical protein
LSRDISFRPVEISFNSGDQILFQFGRQYEFLNEADEISSIQLERGEYEFWRYGLMLASAPRRTLWALFSHDRGGFYDGSRNITIIQSGYKVLVSLFMGLEMEYSEGILNQSKFTREVYRMKVNLLFSPRITLNNYMQYDNVTERMGWQSRFRWIMKPGNEVNLVWNSISEDPFDRFEITESTARLKVQFNYRF